jgi:hypothetical protein
MTTTKNSCSLCGGRLVLFHSIHEKYCPDCKATFKWELTPGQKSTVIDGVTAETVALSQETMTSKEYEDESHGQ